MPTGDPWCPVHKSFSCFCFVKDIPFNCNPNEIFEELEKLKLKHSGKEALNILKKFWQARKNVYELGQSGITEHKYRLYEFLDRTFGPIDNDPHIKHYLKIRLESEKTSLVDENGNAVNSFDPVLVCDYCWRPCWTVLAEGQSCGSDCPGQFICYKPGMIK